MEPTDELERWTEQATVPCTHLHSPPDGGPTPNARLGIWEVISQRGAWGRQPDGHTAPDGDLLLPSAHRPGELVRLPVGTRLACEAVVGLIAIWSQLGEEGLRFRVVDGPSAGECVHLNEDGGPLDQFGLRLVRSGD